MMNNARSNIDANQRSPIIRRSSSSAHEDRAAAHEDDPVPNPPLAVPPTMTMSSSSPISIPAPHPQSGVGAAACSQDSYSSGEDHRADAMGGGGCSVRRACPPRWEN